MSASEAQHREEACQESCYGTKNEQKLKRAIPSIRGDVKEALDPIHNLILPRPSREGEFGEYELSPLCFSVFLVLPFFTCPFFNR